MTLADKAYHSLREKILSGELQGGTRLRQQELARTLKITTNPLREALIRLERDGLVDSEPSMGAKVREWKPEDFINQTNVRLALESELSMLAAERISVVELKELIRLAHDWDSQMLKRADGKLPSLEADVAIHHFIARAARSEKLLQFWHVAILQPKQHQSATYWEEHVRLCQPWSHMLLVQGIASHDPEVARRASRRHIAHSRAVDVHLRGLEWRFPHFAAARVPQAVEEDDFRELLDL